MTDDEIEARRWRERGRWFVQALVFVAIAGLTDLGDRTVLLVFSYGSAFAVVVALALYGSNQDRAARCRGLIDGQREQLEAAEAAAGAVRKDG